MKRLLPIFVFILLVLTNSVFGQKQDLMPINEIREVIKLAIDYPDLQQYYHVEVLPNRIPLVIKEFGIVNSKNLKGLQKFRKDIVILTEEEIKNQNIEAYLKIGEWTYDGQNLQFQFEYDVEGLSVGYKFLKEEGRWKMVDADLWEE